MLVVLDAEPGGHTTDTERVLVDTGPLGSHGRESLLDEWRVRHRGSPDGRGARPSNIGRLVGQAALNLRETYLANSCSFLLVRCDGPPAMADLASILLLCMHVIMERPAYLA